MGRMRKPLNPFKLYYLEKIGYLLLGDITMCGSLEYSRRIYYAKDKYFQNSLFCDTADFSLECNNQRRKCN